MPIEWILANPWPSSALGSETGSLEALRRLDLTQATEIYRIRHRRVLRTSIPPMGKVAVKEVRHLRLKQRFKLRGGGQSKAEREFQNAQTLFSRNVATPAPYALGLDHGLSGLRRVIQIYQWLPDAVSLTECVRQGQTPWDEISAILWKSAQSGLVHGGHSSENLLRSDGRWYVIDLADATLGKHYDREGLVRDAARIARKLLRERALRESELTPYIDALATRAEDPEFKSDIPKAMDLLVEQAKRRGR